MKIVNEFPPNIEKIKKVLNPPHGMVFTYGETIYNPDHGLIADHLMIHEETHAKQQKDDPEGWWDKYLIDKEWRLQQELEAYHNQYKFAEVAIKDRNVRARFLHAIACDLVNYYGGIINYGDALERIKRG